MWRAVALFAVLLVPACAGPGPVPRAELHVAAQYALRSLDPNAENTFGPYEVLSNVYEPLVTLDSQLRVRPALAVSWESPDALTWVFHLREGVRFQSGAVLTAEDAVRSIERVLQSPGLQMRGHLAQVSEVAALDAGTLRLRTSRPTPLLLNHLNFVSITAAAARDLASRSDGTGPFVVEGWDRAQGVRMRRNENYWGEQPELSRLVFHTERGAEQAVEGLLSGTYQMALLNTTRFDGALSGSGRLKLIRQDGLFLRYLGFDLARDVTPYCSVTPNPFRRREVRRALHLALDRQALIGALGNAAVVASQLVPRPVFGFNPGLAEPRPDLAAARALLRQAGVPERFSAVLHTRRRFEVAAATVRQQLAPLGFDVDVRVLPDSEYFEALGRSEFTMWLSGFGCPLGDASELLDNVAHSRDADRGFGINNYGGFQDAAIDRAIEETASQADRGDALQRLMARLMDELIWLPLYFEQDVFAVDRSLDWQPRTDSYLRGAEVKLAR
jgi:peptide/nickel transport system substrate-binding protein